MRNNKWIFCILLAGLLLCGIGGGIMFVEFSGLTYAGEYVFETDTPETKTIEVDLSDAPEGDIQVDCFYYPIHPLKDRLVVDKTMEEGLIRVDVTFDPERTNPSIHLDVFHSEGSEGPAENYLRIQFYSHADDLQLFFLVKDQILKDLQNNTLRSYSTVEVMDLTITTGPKTAGRLIF